MKEIPVRLYDILMHPETCPSGWLYLPSGPWNLETEGIIADDEGDPSPDWEDDVPVKAREDGWSGTVEDQDIGSIIDNLKYEYPNPTAQQRLEAFAYYVENDAFLIV